MKKSLKTEIIAWSAFVSLAFIASAVISLVYSMGFLEVARIIFGVVYVLFLPGYVIVRCFFDDLEDWIEKIGIAFGLSIAVVILAVIVANLLFKIPITPLSNVLIILGAMVLTVAIKLGINKWYKPKHSEAVEPAKPGHQPAHKKQAKQHPKQRAK
jgi:uncharacterized membrane protein